jgi:3-deoxy-manno-octulosonate cytidylyltransferase (CMP-KDO synthetase)
VIAVIIPSRLDSKRLPGKALKDIHGKPLIQRVYEGSVGARSVGSVWVATPDKDIFDVVEEFGGSAVLTGTHGTLHGRVVEANRQIKADVVVIVQGDEPMVKAGIVEAAIGGLYDFGASMIVRGIYTEYTDPKDIKVIVDTKNEIRYITRFPVPTRYKAVGVKAFDAKVLEKFLDLPPHPLELEEGLEELRFVMNGYPMKAVETRWRMQAVDVREDLEKVRAIW